jgi:hypothetical protein
MSNATRRFEGLSNAESASLEGVTDATAESKRARGSARGEATMTACLLSGVDAESGMRATAV